MIEPLQNLISLAHAHSYIITAIIGYGIFIVWLGWMIWAAPRR
ncbi:MAG: hypothetical protein ACXV8Q_19720 [Methylobacter sp.]